MTTTAEFIFATCHAGAEAILKHEISREWPTFKLAYSRPGFLTFKVSPDADVSPGFDLRCVFARAYGISLGRAQGDTRAERANYAAMLARQLFAGPVRLNVFEREKTDLSRRDDDEAFCHSPSPLVTEVERAVRGAQEQAFFPDSGAHEGELVFDVVVVEEGEWWLGYHLQSGYHRPWPGGIARIERAGETPSRAYFKLREGLEWPGIKVREGETVLELGSAPGGATLALLERGLRVLGVDPAEMHPLVRDNPLFRHLRLQAGQLKTADLGGDVAWIVADMNVPPAETISVVEKILGIVNREALLGAFLTLKLNSWGKPETVPELVRTSMERLLQLGFSRVQAAHLFFNRREVGVACYTARGELRVVPAKGAGSAKRRAGARRLGTPVPGDEP